MANYTDVIDKTALQAYDLALGEATISEETINSLGGIDEDEVKTDLALKAKDLYKAIVSTQDKIASLNEGKTAIASAITGKGVETSSDDTLLLMAENVRNIENGYPKVMGVNTISWNASAYDGVVNMNVFEKSGLTNVSGMFLRSAVSGVIAGDDYWRITSIGSMFYYTTKVKFIYLDNVDTSECTEFSYLFRMCSELEVLRVKTLDFASATKNVFFVAGDTKFTTIEVVEGGEGFKNIKMDFSGENGFSSCPFTRSSALVIINGLYDFAAEGNTDTHTISFSTTTKGYLTAEDMAIATAKGWTIA